MQLPINFARARAALAASTVGHTIESYGSVESTMLLARSALQEYPHKSSGLVIVAEEQRQGRGRLERAWETPYGKALLVSVILGEELIPKAVTQLSILVPVVVRRAIISLLLDSTKQQADAHQVMFKWPNDILAGTDAGKIAGALIELSFAASSAQHAILGIGINVNQESHEFPQVPRGSQLPTSMLAISGRNIDRTTLLIELCQALSDVLQKCNNSLATTSATAADITGPLEGAGKMHRPTQLRGNNNLWEEWREHLHTIGQFVTVSKVTSSESEQACGLEGNGASSFEGKAVDVTKEGYLVVQSAQGERREFSSGEVTLRSSST